MTKLSPKALNAVFTVAIVILLLPFGVDIFRGVMNGRREASLGGTDASKITLIDGAELFSEAEDEKLRDDMIPVTSFYPVAVVTTSDTGGVSTPSYAARTYRSVFGGSDGIVFLIDMDNRYLYLYTSDSNTRLSAEKCDSITDNVYRYASAGDYVLCAEKALEQTRQVMAGISIPQPMKHMSNALVALSAALLGVFVYAVSKTGIKPPQEVYQLDPNRKKSIRISNVTSKLIRTYTYSNSS
ncbi:MAG: TPM domain-containing protein, partial [Clostridia bacterium]|nr:TPM domain-containing protein [Clostridia bacterium]